MKTSKIKKLISAEISYNEFLEDQFKRLFFSYTLAINKQEKRTGSLFQKRFKRIGINNKIRLMNRLAYIHHNPIHHKFTSGYKEWKFSSYHIFINNQPTLINKEYVLEYFDNDTKKAQKAFIKYHEEFKFVYQFTNP